MKKLSLISLLFVGSWVAQAQNTMDVNACVTYALENHPSIKMSEQDLELAENKVKETIAIGLPQINGKIDLIDNLSVQTQYLPNEGPFGNPNDPSEVLPVQFGVQYSGTANMTLSQLLFDGSYFVGLQAAQAYTDLSKTSINQSKVSVVENVYKAYYLVLINKERVKLLETNKELLEKLKADSKVLVENGFLEAVDLKRTEVSINNLTVNITKLNNLLKVSQGLLKLQMGMPQTEEVNVSGTMKQLEEMMVDPVMTELNYSNRIEHQLLGQQLTLQELNLKNERVKILPSAAAFASLGANNGAQSFGNLFAVGDWNSYSMIGLSIDVPIWSSFRRKHRMAQVSNDINKLSLQQNQLEQVIDFEIIQSKTNLKDNVAAMEVQKETIDLAQDVYDNVKIKYDEGVSSSFELLEAENSLRESQTNYFEALYNAVLSKIELQKSTGTLYQF